MNLDLDDPKLHQELWDWYRSIAVVICRRRHYFIIDFKEYFSILDGEKYYKILIESGRRSREKIEQNRAQFRGGISQLTRNNFAQYLELPDTHVIPTERMRQFFFDPKLGDFDIMQDHLERHCAFGDEFDQDRLMMRRKLKTRLPTFYINFDRNIYLHMDWGRFHETLVYDGWYARVEDFGSNIPVAERYWWSDKADFWPVRFFTA